MIKLIGLYNYQIKEFWNFFFPKRSNLHKRILKIWNNLSTGRFSIEVMENAVACFPVIVIYDDNLTIVEEHILSLNEEDMDNYYLTQLLTKLLIKNL